ncbi:hypothetical protein AGABI2DRAFT_185359 [Agaricus bisporus var. bisporus H97]|uniref:hypothetical protein n=1 Tax=Agaricus bisporus var. bisporus (strain H97 / ATCC MYA-4626 / FGSC 10389) TaxID=936046 RepID=UPI00029F756F|nr:hypothetical protein AGABI2DRAFT_185359 [Agaricus bisporus var. bisporus H97]EKV47412.1 hypothetical protein AGABI2DRAFT_185359 [Agaricus bisporus var. bisporus H97]
MNREVAQQERELRDMLRRAEDSSDLQGPLRQETLKRLISLVHSPHTPLKILAAGNMRFFLKDFPDLEEAAIDAIYDLCEDSSAQVRIEGYHAITQVSRTQGKWIKRNVDVLVQLLQSEDIQEVGVVKLALVEHLNMDFKITISVLCDQIIPRDDVSDEEEVSIRERLRFLVLAFMTGEAKSAICERQFLPGDAAESVLYDGLFAAVPHLGVDDLQLAVKGLICSLPAFKSKKPTGKGSDLLQLLLTGKLTASLKADLQSESKSLSPTTKALLDICEHITCVLFAAPAIDLLQFYYYSLIGKIALQRLPVDEQRWIVGHLARILSVAEKQATLQHSNLRWRVVDATPYLFEVYQKSKISEPEFQAIYDVFIQACFKRSKDSSWVVPTNILKVLQEYRPPQNIAQNQEYENIFRSFSQSNQVPTPNNGALQNNATTSTSRSNTSSTPALRAPALRPSGSLPEGSGPVNRQAGSEIRDTKHGTSMRPAKRTKVEEVANPQRAPSLLSRLSDTISRQPSHSNLSPGVQSTFLPEEKRQPEPTQGLSIKGAATKQASQNGGDPISRPTSSSLLERLQGPYLKESGTRQADAGRKRKIV